MWELWTLSCTQWRATGFSVIGLDYLAVVKLAEIYDIELTSVEMNKLRYLEALELRHIRERAKEVERHGE